MLAPSHSSLAYGRRHHNRIERALDRVDVPSFVHQFCSSRSRDVEVVGDDVTSLGRQSCELYTWDFISADTAVRWNVVDISALATRSAIEQVSDCNAAAGRLKLLKE